MKCWDKRGNIDIVSILLMGLATLMSILAPASNLITGDAVLTISDMNYSIETTDSTSLYFDSGNSLHIYLHSLNDLKVPYFDYYQISGAGKAQLNTSSNPTFPDTVESTDWQTSSSGSNLYHPNLGISQYTQLILEATSPWTLGNVTILSTVNTPPTLSSIQVLPTSGGWGETFTFSTDVTDVDGDDVNLTLYVNTTSGWVSKGVQYCNPCSGSNSKSWVISNLDATYIGNRQFKIEKTDDYTIYNSSAYDFVVEQNNVTIVALDGNGVTVNRSTGSISLQIEVTDTDRTVKPSGVDVSFYVQKGGGVPTLHASSTTLTDGVLTANINPGAEFTTLGDKDWYVTTTDSDYENKRSSTYSFNLLGTMTDTWNGPTSGNSYAILTEIPFSVSFEDDLGAALTDDHIDPFFQIRKSGGSWLNATDYGCDLSDGINEDGTFTCNLNTGNLQEGDYDVSILTTRTNFNDNQIQSLAHFTLTGATTEGTVVLNPANLNIPDVMAASSQDKDFEVTFTNNGDNVARDMNLSLALPAGWTGGNLYTACNDVSANTPCGTTFTINIPAGEVANTYQITAYAFWTEPNGDPASTSHQGQVVIAPNYETVITNDLVVNVNHDSSNIVGNFTITAIGNADPGVLSFSIASGTLPDAWVTTNPSAVSLTSGDSEKIGVNITVPRGITPQSYSGNFTASNLGDFFADSWLNATLLSSKTWEVPNPTEMRDLAPGESGIYRTFYVENTGNVDLTFTRNNPTGEPDLVDSIDAYSDELMTPGSTKTIRVTYDIPSEKIPSTYYVNFTLFSSGATPGTLLISCGFALEDQPPVINSVVDAPDPVDLNNENITIMADVEDFVHVDNVWAIVTNPDLTTTPYSFSTVSVTANNTGTWETKFVPDQSGTYSYVVWVNDSSNLNDSLSGKSFTSVTTTDLDLTLNFTSVTEVVTNSPRACSASLEGVDVGGCVKINATIEAIGPGAGYLTVFNFGLPQGWNSSFGDANLIGKIADGETEINSYSIGIPVDTSEGLFTLNATVTWTNPDETTDSETKQFQVQVSNIVSNLTAQIHSPNPSGQTFRVGDQVDFLFEILDLDSNPISNLDTISFDIDRNGNTISNPCTLSGSQNNYSCSLDTAGYVAGEYDIIVTGTELYYTNLDYTSLNPFTLDNNNMSADFVVDPVLLEIDNMTTENDYVFNARYTFTNLPSSEADARFTNITLVTIPQGWQVSNSGMQNCNNIAPSLSCQKDFTITIPAGFKLDSTLIANATYMTPENFILTKSAPTVIDFELLPDLEIEGDLLANVIHNSQNDVGSFLIKSIGTVSSRNTNFSLSQLSDPTIADWISYEYDSMYIPVGFLVDGSNTTINVTVDVPAGQPDGLYTALFDVYSEINTVATKMDSRWLNLSVLKNYNWNLSHDSVVKTVQQGVPSGSLFNLTISNLGNDQYSFSWQIQQNVNSEFNETNMVLEDDSRDIAKMVDSVVEFYFVTASDQEPGLYRYDIIIQNSDYGVQRTIPINITVADLPPQISNVLINKEYVDINNENATITADITDSIMVDEAWMNITLDGDFLAQADLAYNTGDAGTQSGQWIAKFMPEYAGDYGIIIYANDSSGLTNYTPISYTFEAIAVTGFNIDLSPTSPTVTTVTQTQSADVEVEMNITNTGNGAGYTVNLSFEKTAANVSDFEISPSYLEYASVSEDQSYSNDFTVTVPAGTAPGEYILRPKVRWIHPSGQVASRNEILTINVTSNPILSFEELGLDLIVNHGGSNSTTINSRSRGNDDLTDVEFVCEASGEATDICTNFDFTFSPNYFDIAAGIEREVTVTAQSEPGLAPDTYYGTITASSDELEEDSVSVNIVVPEGKQWTSTDDIDFKVGLNNTGTIGNFVVTNNGNVALNFTIDVIGNISSIFTLNTTPVEIEPQGAVTLPYGYNSTGLDPNTYSGLINVSCIECGNYSESLVDIEILNYTLRRIIPVAPLTDKEAGDAISMRVAATDDDGIINTSINWEVYLDDYACLNTTSSYDTSWLISCYLPNIPSGIYYDLVIQGTDNTTSAIATSTFTNGVHYLDIEPPEFSNVTTNDVEIGNPVTIIANVSDNVALANVTVNISFPGSNYFNVSNGTLVYSILENLVEQPDETWQYIFTNTSFLGDYDIVVSAVDTKGIEATESATFEVYREIQVNLTIAEENQDVILTDITLFKELSSRSLIGDSAEIQIETDIDEANPVREITVHERTYDVEFRIFNHTITLIETNFTNTSMLNVTVEQLVTNNVDIGNDVFVDGFGIEVSSIDFSAATILFNYSNLLAGTEIKADNLYAARCSNWNSVLNSCGTGGWSLLDYQWRESDTTIWSSTTGFSAFALMEEIADVAAPSGGNSGGGGGGGGYAGISSTNNIAISTAKIEKTLYPTETAVDSFTLTNQGDDDVSLTISIHDVDDFISISDSVIKLTAGETESVIVDFDIPVLTYPGIYTGTISVVGANVEYSVPVEITVRDVEFPVLELTLDIVSQEVVRNGTLSYELEMKNIGGEMPGFEVELYTFILNITDGELGSDEELVLFEDSFSISRNFQIPEDMPLGDFKLKVLALYFGKETTTFSTFKVTQSSRLEGPLKDWIPPKLIDFVFQYRFIIVLGLVGAYLAVLGIKKASQISVRHYEFPVPLIKKLPGASTAAINIGQITELNKPSFVNLKDLTMHGICVGATGGGKTVSAQVIVEEALKRGVNVIVLDPTGQWSGFLQRCNDPEMLANYSRFNMRSSEARGFNGNIRAIENASHGIDIKPFLVKNKQGVEGEIQIFSLHKLKNKDLEMFVNSMIKQVFDAHLEESNTLETLIVFDEVHRLLESFGGSMKGQDQLERGVREFRKWGIGLLLISQVISDFKPQIRANIGTKIQFRSRDKNDLNMIKETFGIEYVRHIVKAMIGRGMFHNPAYNKGMPYFVDVKPLLHHPHKLMNAELEKYEHYNKLVDTIKRKMKIMQAQGKDVFDIISILKLLEKNIKKGKFDMVDIYLEEINEKLNR